MVGFLSYHSFFPFKLLFMFLSGVLTIGHYLTWSSAFGHLLKHYCYRDLSFDVLFIFTSTFTLGLFSPFSLFFFVNEDSLTFHSNFPQELLGGRQTLRNGL